MTTKNKYATNTFDDCRYFTPIGVQRRHWNGRRAEIRIRGQKVDRPNDVFDLCAMFVSVCHLSNESIIAVAFFVPPRMRPLASCVRAHISCPMPCVMCVYCITVDDKWFRFYSTEIITNHTATRYGHCRCVDVVDFALQIRSSSPPQNTCREKSKRFMDL